MKKMPPRNQWVLPTNHTYDLGLMGRDILTGYRGIISTYRASLATAAAYELVSESGESRWVDMARVEVFDSRELYRMELDDEP